MNNALTGSCGNIIHGVGDSSPALAYRADK